MVMGGIGSGASVDEWGRRSSSRSRSKSQSPSKFITWFIDHAPTLHKITSQSLPI